MTGSCHCHWLLRGTHSSPWLALGLPTTDRRRSGSSSCHQDGDSLSLGRLSATMFYHLSSLCLKSLTFLSSLSSLSLACLLITIHSSLLFCTFCTAVQCQCTEQDKPDNVQKLYTTPLCLRASRQAERKV